MKNYTCEKCGLSRKTGTREQTRDFVFADICIKCNKSFKALKYFKTLESYQEYLRAGGSPLDSVNIAGVDYTNDLYDWDGKQMTYGNIRTKKAFSVDTQNRYDKALKFKDAVITGLYELWPRNDLNYLD